jgi:hypothetical protein
VSGGFKPNNSAEAAITPVLAPVTAAIYCEPDVLRMCITKIGMMLIVRASSSLGSQFNKPVDWGWGRFVQLYAPHGAYGLLMRA